MMLKSMHIEKWRQFGVVDIEFDSRLTVITGENSTGKTTILNLLSKVLNTQDDPVTFLATKEKDGSGITVWSAAIENDLPVVIERQTSIGSIDFSPPTEQTQLVVATPDSPKLSIFARPSPDFPGVLFNSYRKPFEYVGLGELPLNSENLQAMFTSYQQRCLVKVEYTS